MAMIIILVFSPLSETETFSSFVSARKTTLMLLSRSGPVSVGDLLQVDVVVDTALPTTGVDVVLEYDPTILGPQPSATSNVTPASSIYYLGTTNSAFDIFPRTTLSHADDSSTATLTFSALANPLREVQGREVVASLAFRALKSGIATVRFSRAGSHVARLGADILRVTNDLQVHIQ